MKLAVFGDIHGNIEALKAAYNACSGKADRMYHLGDLGGYAPFVNEVVDFLLEHAEKSTHVLNAVSPAFTSAFSFARHIVDSSASRMNIK